MKKPPFKPLLPNLKFSITDENAQILFQMGLAHINEAGATDTSVVEGKVQTKPRYEGTERLGIHITGFVCIGFACLVEATVNASAFIVRPPVA